MQTLDIKWEPGPQRGPGSSLLSLNHDNSRTRLYTDFCEEAEENRRKQIKLLRKGESFMKAIGLYRYLPIEDPESLLDIEIENPVPGGRDLLVNVKAISVNPVDTKVRAPKNQVETSPRILGWDVAGVVEQVGPDCTLFQPGDEVYYAGSINRPGGNSEFHLVDERLGGPKRRGLDFAQSAVRALTHVPAWGGLL